METGAKKTKTHLLPSVLCNSGLIWAKRLPSDGHCGVTIYNEMLKSVCALLSIRGMRPRILFTQLRPCHCLAWWFEGVCVGPAMTVRDTGCDSMAECQHDICGPSVTLGVALLLPKRHQWDHLTALAILTGRNPHTSSWLHCGDFGSCLNQNESYKLLPQM